ncbi:serine/threonine-protein kinase/endoribonuclease IRE2-like [Daphnia carinata]|uniref:serine/threonine-protein kinase/endoribonuclease IRE2-like n=1 Tax=Daphnia carinata TaxID=120202 RepID=UPI00257FA249|nr:serine/threonine-protein kinase/endoribonuclease IRE2-like [Daphnia carinata]
MQYDKKDFIGRGAFGSVFLGTFKGKKVAIKRIELVGEPVPVVDNELEALQQLDHPNVVKLLHCESDDTFKYFALEFCDGSLDKLFLKSYDQMKYKGPTPLPIEMFLHLASGLAYIHSRGLTHRDIKPENILISVKMTEQGEQATMKWGDFGLCRPVNERGTYTMSRIRGTRFWFAPELYEILESNVKYGNRGTVNSDVFAEGLVFGYILLNGNHLYGSDDEVMTNIKQNIPINIHKIHNLHWARSLLTKMLTTKPTERIASRAVVTELQSIQTKLGWNALHWVCANNSNSNLMNEIELSIKRGIDTNAKSNEGLSALHVLCTYNSSPYLTDAIEFLIQSGMDGNAKDNNGFNVLHTLCAFNSSSNLIEPIEKLIQLGIDVSAKSDNGANALHVLCKESSSKNLIEAIKLLIHLGIDIHAKDKNGWNALHFLCEYNSSENLFDAVKVLIERGIEINSNGYDAQVLLRKNYKSGNLEEILKLFEKTYPGNG